MLVILEGNECVYKTTVAEKLNKKLGYEVRKGSSFEMSTSTNENLYQSFNEMTEWDNVIIDRFVFSNRVYASLFPKYTILTDEQYKDIQLKVRDKSLVVYLYAGTDILKERMSKRGDEYIQEDQLEGINRFYDGIMKYAIGKRVIYIDTGYRTSDEIVEIIESELEDM